MAVPRKIRPLLFDLLVCVIVLAAVDTPHEEACGPSGCFKRFYGPQLYPHQRYFDRFYRAHPPGLSNWNRDFRETPR